MNISMDGLFNDIDEYGSAYSNQKEYYSFLLEQWKTAISLTSDISNRKRSMNNFYVTVLSLLCTAALAIYEKIEESWFVIVVISVVGIAFSLAWLIGIKEYKTLNSVKFEIINEIEKKLPVNLLQVEWRELKKIQYEKMAVTDIRVAWLFVILFVGALGGSVTMLFWG